ncbi:MAG: HigA family addiction module antidote protein [Acidobacteriaceae bacterium]|nr:HigA family addiction module antidote protein [Acidobacteriaceae bacterium]
MKLKSLITTSGPANHRLLPIPTPGEILLEEFLKPLSITAHALAIELRVPANRIHGIVRGRRSITADTALRLAQYFGNSAEFWLNLQRNYELNLARREKLTEIQSFVPRRPPAEKPLREKATLRRNRARSRDQ